MNISKLIVTTGSLPLAVLLMLNASAAYSATQAVTSQNSAAQRKDIVTTRLENITKRLDLSAEQQAEVKLILLGESTKLNEHGSNTNLTVSEKKTKLHDLQNSTDNSIRIILTTEQQKKQDAFLIKRNDRPKNK